MPGAGKQPPEVQAHIKELLEAGFDPTTIHRRLKVGRSSIYRMKRSLQQHGSAYMPSELNKKNGRPKVLTPEQELEVRAWLLQPANRTRYLDDLVWMIHDRFGIVCSTTTMSKLKRKWLAVIEAEEAGRPIDPHNRALLLETHPHLPLLHRDLDDAGAFADGVGGDQHGVHHLVDPDDAAAAAAALHMQRRAQAADAEIDAQIDARLTAEQYDHNSHIDARLAGEHHHHDPNLDARLTGEQHHHHSQIDARLAEEQHDGHYHNLDPAIDEQLKRQLQNELAASS